MLWNWNPNQKITDKKSLVKTDSFGQKVLKIYHALSQHSFFIGGLTVMALVFFLGLSFFWSHQKQREQIAKNLLFRSIKLLDQQQNESNSQKIDWTQQKPQEVIDKLEKLILDYPRTSAAFEASLKLGNLYFENQHFHQALDWYQKALPMAPKRFETTVLLMSIAYSYENLLQPEEALKFFQKALSIQQNDSLKADILMSIARLQEELKITQSARKTYDQIITELPHSSEAQSASLFKDQLPE